MFKIGFLIGVFLIVGIGIYGYYNLKSAMSDVTVKPIELAQLELENLKGEKAELKKGKPIIINFWATWCVPCVKEFPEFEEINNMYSNKVGIYMVSDEESSQIEKFKNRKGYKLNFLRSLKPFEKYGLVLRPATYIYDSSGTLISKIAGGISKKELETEILKVLKN